MYETSRCGYYKQANVYFRANKIPFQSYDIETSATAKRRFDKLGGTGVPLILYNSKKMTGFSASSFAQMYGPSEW